MLVLIAQHPHQPRRIAIANYDEKTDEKHAAGRRDKMTWIAMSKPGPA